MKPYWSDDTIQLFLGDCREVTEWLGADVLVTDPPYGRGWKQGDIKFGHPTWNGHKGITQDSDTAARDHVLTLWSGRLAVVFGDLMSPPPADSKMTLIYRKPSNAGARGAMGGFRRDAEAVYLLGPWPSGLGGRTSIIETGARSQGGPVGAQTRYQHPHAKPVDVLETLIAATPPGTIADPFCGSGSTLVAARNQGRQAIGVEIDERYAEQAARRLSQQVMVTA